MIRFLAARAFQAALVLLVMSLVVVALIGLMPGDPVDMMASAIPNLRPEDIARLHAVYGVDRPVMDRWIDWLGAALSGDLGYSRLTAQPVLATIWPALLRTLALVGIAFPIALAFALPAGIAAAAKPGTLVEWAAGAASFAALAVPPFWLALIAITVFAAILGWLPANAVSSAAAPTLLDQARHLAMPIGCLAMLMAGGLVRYTRAAVREVMGRDFVRTARAKGLGPWRTVTRHVLRNAAIPIVTVIALEVGSLLSGALITEIMFGYPGMGKLIYDAIMGNDYNLALVGLLFATAMTLAAAFLADLAYALLDPRVGFGSRGR